MQLGASILSTFSYIVPKPKWDRYHSSNIGRQEAVDRPVQPGISGNHDPSSVPDRFALRYDVTYSAEVRQLGAF
jgi:hypothetical protein